MRSVLNKLSYRLVDAVQDHIKRWLKPNTLSLTGGATADLTRSKADLIAENALLRQQLIILQRQSKRPQISNFDRIKLLLLARATPYWKQALLIVQPDTLLRWHRDLFRIIWRRKSKPKSQSPRIIDETIDLIRQMAADNQTWGAERIRGELLKLGIQVSKRTVQKYMNRKVSPSPSGQTWSTFLKNHASQIWACDFIQVIDIIFRSLFVFVIIEHASRRIVHVAVTSHPSDAWVAQQLREATPWGEGPKYLIRDNDSKFGQHFSAVAAGTGIKEIRTPYHAPNANAICERYIGTLRRECLDHMIILNHKHLNGVSQEFVAFYNEARPHQGLQQRIPIPPADQQGSGMVLQFPFWVVCTTTIAAQPERRT
jgi:transposase InsO family protein